MTDFEDKLNAAVKLPREIALAQGQRIVVSAMLRRQQGPTQCRVRVMAHTAREQRITAGF